MASGQLSLATVTTTKVALIIDQKEVIWQKIKKKNTQEHGEL